MRIRIASTSSIDIHHMYAANEAVVAFLDAECRPLLDMEPEASVVAEVCLFMSERNDDSSSLSCNCSASLNGSSLGDAYGVRYLASHQAKTVEQYWAAKYAMIPDAEPLQSIKSARDREKRTLEDQMNKLRIEYEKNSKEREEKERRKELQKLSDAMQTKKSVFLKALERALALSGVLACTNNRQVLAIRPDGAAVYCGYNFKAVLPDAKKVAGRDCAAILFKNGTVRMYNEANQYTIYRRKPVADITCDKNFAALLHYDGTVPMLHIPGQSVIPTSE